MKSIKTDGKLDKYLREISRIRARADVGFFEGAKYPTGESVAAVAYKNETGGGGNPRRPFMERTLLKNQRKWVNGIVRTLKGGKINRAAVMRAYDLAGQVAEGDIKRTIADWNPTDPRANSPATIRRKAERTAHRRFGVALDPRRALIDTGLMIKSVTHRVEM